MNIRTSIIAAGVTLALVVPAAANARAVTNQVGDTYLVTEHGQAGKRSQSADTSFFTEHSAVGKQSQSAATYFFTEHSLGFTLHSGKQATQAIAKKSSGKSSTASVKPDVIRAPYGPTSVSTPSYIDASGPVTSTPYVDPNECQDNGTNCTAIQLCTYWGQNCSGSPAGAAA
jgi:hypothetical protein